MGCVDYEAHGRTRLIRMNRPEALNAMNRDLLVGLAEAFTAFSQDDDAFVAVLSGTGRAYSVGMDIKERAESADGGIGLADISPLVDPFFPYRAAELDKPVIAAVNGMAFGGGFILAANADLVVAGESATFEITEVKRGAVAGWQYGLAQGLPLHICLELAYGGRLTAQRAHDVGFVNEVVPDDEVEAAALTRAEQLTSLPPLALRFNRELLMEFAQRPSPELWARSHSLFRQAQESVDAREAQRAFLEKRPPVYQGR